jgi:hypothetical protein
MNTQLIKAVDFNEKIRERGADEDVTVQHVCRIAKDEAQVREVLEAVWKEPEKAGGLLERIAVENGKLFEFEKMLEEDKSRA